MSTRYSNNSLEYHHLVPKAKTKSQVWDTFGLPANEHGTVLNSDVAICKLCLRSVCGKGGSTTNLLSHMKVHHPFKYSEITSKRPAFSTVPLCSVAPNNPDNPPVVSTAGEWPHKVQKTMMEYQPLDKNADKRCTQAVTEYLATTMQSYNIVEHEKFVNMIKIMNPRYKLPGRKYFSQTAVPKLYNDTVSKLKNILSQISETDVSITTDCWTSIANTPFLGITIHFISPEWKLINACLSCKHFDDNHTADNIGQVLTDIMSEWGINIKKISCCVTDNGSNILKAVQQLEVPHLSCFAHNINIGVNKALELHELKKAVGRLKCLQSSISHSWKMKRDLSRAQETLNMEQGSLPSACPTRWWSTAKLCNKFLKNQLAVCKMLLEYPSKKHLMVEGNEIAAIEDFVSATALLEDMTRTLSGNNYLTASSVLPLYARIKKHLEHENTDSEILKKIKSEILKPLREKYGSLTSMALNLGISTLCDPRFRLRFLECPDLIKERTIKEMSGIYNNNVAPVSNATQSALAQQIEKKGLARFLDFDDCDEDTDDDVNINEKKAEKEMNEYLSMPRVDCNDCPLLWWKTHRASFPLLEILARKYLPIPGTSVPCERVFSSGGSVITKQRASLKPKNAEMQVFLAQNKDFV